MIVNLYNKKLIIATRMSPLMDFVHVQFQIKAKLIKNVHINFSVTKSVLIIIMAPNRFYLLKNNFPRPILFNLH